MSSRVLAEQPPMWRGVCFVISLSQTSQSQKWIRLRESSRSWNTFSLSQYLLCLASFSCVRGKKRHPVQFPDLTGAPVSRKEPHIQQLSNSIKQEHKRRYSVPRELYEEWPRLRALKSEAPRERTHGGDTQKEISFLFRADFFGEGETPLTVDRINKTVSAFHMLGFTCHWACMCVESVTQSFGSWGWGDGLRLPLVPVLSLYQFIFARDVSGSAHASNGPNWAYWNFKGEW